MKTWFLTSTTYRRCKLPFGNSALLVVWGAPKAGKPRVSPVEILCPSSGLNWKYLPGVAEASTTIWSIYFKNLVSHKLCSAPIAAFSSKWSWHLPLSCLASSHTRTPCAQRWACLWAGTAERGVSVRPAGRRPEWSELCGCVGWGLEGGECRTDLEPTVQLLQQVWLVLGAQRQLCFSSNFR